MSTNNVWEQKEVTVVFPDGAYLCPFCLYAVKFNERCGNPACEMNLDYVTIIATRHLRVLMEKEAEQVKHAREAYAETKRTQRATLTREVLTEAKARGACTNLKCLFPKTDNTVRFTKHRKKCPNT